MSATNHHLSERYTLGWDIGGAHLKACLLDQNGRVLKVWQLACPVWQGLPILQKSLQEVLSMSLAYGKQAHLTHAVTMTAELVDLFADRQDGVKQIAYLLQDELPHASLYAGKQGFVPLSSASQYATQIASANWLASAEWIAQHYENALLVDIGSTTTDFVLIKQACVCNLGSDDAQRLQTDELLYTGVVRTPLMAISPRIEWLGKHANVAAEYFATSADVYRLTGELAESHDQAASADGKDKSIDATCRRLARMVGADVDSASQQQWLALAQSFKSAQLELLKQSFMRLVRRQNIAQDVPLLGVGAGAFLAKQLAEQCLREFVSPVELIPTDCPDKRDMLMVCFPAFAVASLRQSHD